MIWLEDFPSFVASKVFEDKSHGSFVVNSVNHAIVFELINEMIFDVL